MGQKSRTGHQPPQLAVACGARFTVLPGGHDLMLHESAGRLAELIEQASSPPSS